MNRLKALYQKEIIPKLKKRLGYKNLYQLPELEKICLNMGLGEAIQNPKIIEEATSIISQITGQRPIIVNAKKSVAGFKLRKGKPIGVKVTLRRDKMYEFFDRLINFAIPRIRDFRGLNPSSFDGKGNYNFGISEQTIFPEIKPDAVKSILGMDITICITTEKDNEAYELLSLFGMPFKNRG